MRPQLAFSPHALKREFRIVVADFLIARGAAVHPNADLCCGTGGPPACRAGHRRECRWLTAGEVDLCFWPDEPSLFHLEVLSDTVRRKVLGSMLLPVACPKESILWHACNDMDLGHRWLRTLLGKARRECRGGGRPPTDVEQAIVKLCSGRFGGSLRPPRQGKDELLFAWQPLQKHRRANGGAAAG